MFRPLALCLLAACGRFGFDPAGAVGGDDIAGDGAVGDGALVGEPRPAVVVGGIAPLPSGTLDLAAVATPTGYTVAWVELAGSAPRGLRFDHALVPDGDHRTMTAESNYTSIGLGWTGNLVATLTAATQVFTKRYTDDNLVSHVPLDSEPGRAAVPGVVTAGTRYFYATGEATQLVVRELDAQGNTVGTFNTTPFPAPTIATITAQPDVLHVAWEHPDDDCRINRITVPSNNTQSRNAGGTCHRPRLASRGGPMPDTAFVYDDDTTVYFRSAHQGLGTRRTLGPGADARVAFANQFWLVWRDGDGLVAASLATLDAMPTRYTITGLPASANAFELVAGTDDSIVVFVAADSALYTARLQ